MMNASIVIIEDETDILEVIKFNLEQEGALVKAFLSATEAHQHIKNFPPDLVLSDWNIPGMSGLELCKRLKMNPDTMDIPFVMLTAKSDEIDAVTALEVGADEFLTKPLRLRELVVRLKKLLRKKEHQPYPEADLPGQDEMIHFKDLRIDLARHRVYFANRELALTLSEFKLILLFVKNPGKVFTRNQIIEKLNGFDYLATERSIDVQIVGLRKKLKDGYIETVRGVGYRLFE